MSLPYHVQRWTRRSILCTAAVGGLQLLLLAGPALFSANVLDHLTTFFVYALLAITWNALAGYGGLVSVGQQMFFGVGAYAAIRLSGTGLPVYAALALGGVASAILAFAVSGLMLRLRGGEFAIGMWVLAALTQRLVSLDPIVQGSTGTSLLALNAFSPSAQRMNAYWFGLVAMSGLALALFLLLRSRFGVAVQAIRDDESAARSVGVQVHRSKVILFVLSAFGAGLAGCVWLSASVSFQPNTYFGVQWTAAMIFMTLVGGIGTFEGPILGALIYFGIETGFDADGVWYLIGVGVTAILVALLLPKGLWGWLEQRYALRLLPVGYWLRIRAEDMPRTASRAAVAPALSTTEQS
ncbi:branched-chain amino acid ABC transporter permease [Acidisoma sp. 7E03]